MVAANKVRPSREEITDIQKAVNLLNERFPAEEGEYNKYVAYWSPDDICWHFACIDYFTYISHKAQILHKVIRKKYQHDMVFVCCHYITAHRLKKPQVIFVR